MNNHQAQKNHNTKPKLLVFIGYYLPGYKSGGPLRTIVNMAEHLSAYFEFWIVTRDRDLGDAEQYPSVFQDTWQMVGQANVYYISPKNCSTRKIANLIAATNHDLLYLNSFFDSNFTIKPLIGRRLLGSTNKPVIVAPRGEFSPGALNLKKTKKILYIKTSKLVNLYGGVYFQASSEHEARNTSEVLNIPISRIITAIDLPDAQPPSLEETTIKNHPERTDSLKVIFLSRISPMKNLDFALEILAFTQHQIQFDIYGPLEDQSYWAECQRLIKKLPANITTKYHGSVQPDKVKETFGKYDLFLFPTRGENYGHVIAESLSVGTPILLSDQTPWRGLEADGLGWDIPLNSPRDFSEKINLLARTAPELRKNQRITVKQHAQKRLLDPKAVEANREMFNSLIRVHG